MEYYDHYVEAKEIADRIEAQGFVDSADKIRQAINEGISGTEIFMKLRFYLSPLVTADVTPNTKGQIKILLEKINNVLMC